MKLFLGCVLTCCLFAVEKTEIRGIVSDEAAAVIQNARLELDCAGSGKSKPASNAATETNAKGEFAFQHVLHGACAIKISAPGFHSVQVSLGPPKKRPMEIGTIRLSVKS